MFRNNKVLKRNAGENTAHDKVSVPEFHRGNGLGLGSAMLGGMSAAWTKSFAKDHFSSNKKPEAALKPQVSADDLLADVDMDLLNPHVDDLAWAAPWYAEKIANSKVNAALQDKPDGAFIIRDSSSQPGCFAMSYRFLNRTHHTLINSSAHGIHLAKSNETFACLSELVSRYSTNFNRTGDDDLPCALRTDIELPVEGKQPGAIVATTAAAAEHDTATPPLSTADSLRTETQTQSGDSGVESCLSSSAAVDTLPPPPPPPPRTTATADTETDAAAQLPLPPPPPPLSPTTTTTALEDEGASTTTASATSTASQQQQHQQHQQQQHEQEDTTSPAVPSRRNKPAPSPPTARKYGAKDKDPLPTDEDGVPILKPGVMLCPHCNARQAKVNLICSCCNKRLDGTDPAQRRRSKNMDYTDYLPRTLYQKDGGNSEDNDAIQQQQQQQQQQHEEAEEEEEGQVVVVVEEEEEEHVDGSRAEHHQIESGSVSSESSTSQLQESETAATAAAAATSAQEAEVQAKSKKEKDKKTKKEKKKVRKKRKNAVEIVVDPLPVGLHSILKAVDDGAAYHQQSNRNVHFDEESIETTAAEMAFLRGAAGRVDDLAWDCGYYLDDMITRPEQAASKLTGSTAGMFVIYEDTTGEDALTLSYVGANNVVDHQTITHSYDGLQLNDQGPHFKFLSDLVHHYAEAREGAPAMLFLSQAQRDLIERVTKAMSTQDAHTRTRRASKDLGDQAQTDKGPHNSAPAPAHFAQPWYHGEMSRAEAVALVEFEPSGTFVVRDNHDEPGRYILTFVHNGGELGHVEIKPYGDGFALEEEGAVEKPTLQDLMSFYATDQGLQTKHLPTKLRLPKTTHTLAAPPVLQTPLSPPPPGIARRPTPAPPIASRRGEKQQQQQPAQQQQQPPPPPPPPMHLLPPPPSHAAKRASAASISTAGMACERPGWLQTNMPKAQALQCIAGLPDGAFVIRSSETRAQCYVLSYKFHQQVHHELIKHTPTPTIRFFLSRSPNKTFGSLQELVECFKTPSSELKYPLIPGYIASAATPPEFQGSRDASRRASRKSLLPPGAKPPMLRQSSRNGGLAASEDARRSASAVSLMSSSGAHDLTRARSSRRSRSRRESARMSVGGERLDQRAAASKWCCLNLSKDEAVAKLPKKEGAFIIRRSTDYFAALTMIANGKPQHFYIEGTTQGLRIKKSSSFQPNLSALVAFYKIRTQPDLPRCLMDW